MRPYLEACVSARREHSNNKYSFFANVNMKSVMANSGFATTVIPGPVLPNIKITAMSPKQQTLVISPTLQHTKFHERSEETEKHWLVQLHLSSLTRVPITFFII